jgi:predicted transcriptional regulator of viral defense system
MQVLRTMRIVEIIKIIRKSGVKIVSLSDLRKLLDIEKDNTSYKIAEKLVAEKFLLRLKKGVYLSAFNPPDSFEIANAIYTPSYISLESALNYYGVLPQFPYSVTSVSPKKSKKLLIDEKEFEYVQINHKLYWGFRREGQTVIASPEKALLDMIYIASKGLRRIEFEDLDYSPVNKSDFHKMCQRIDYLPFLNKLKEIGI